MECVCGFEQGYAWITPEGESDWDSENIMVNPSGDRFIKIDGGFTVDSEMRWDSGTTKKVRLYACPKCATIQLKED